MMDIILNAVIYTLLLSLVVYFGFRNVMLKRKLMDEISNKLQAIIDRNIYVAQYHEALQQIENSKLEKTDDFIKFLSDSREAAFEYIEKTQEALFKFDKEVQQIFDWSETYGTATGSGPHSEKIKDISLAYQQLKELLPENKQTPNN